MPVAKRRITYIHVSANRDSLGHIPIASKSNAVKIVSAPATTNVSGDEKEIHNVVLIVVYYCSHECQDPCPYKSCVANSRCVVTNHEPSCHCEEGFEGNGNVRCSAVSVDPCNPSPCGPFSTCHSGSNNLAACSCMAGYSGSPPSCRPECSQDSDCGSLTRACKG